MFRVRVNVRKTEKGACVQLQVWNFDLYKAEPAGSPTLFCWFHYGLEESGPGGTAVVVRLSLELAEKDEWLTLACCSRGWDTINVDAPGFASASAELQFGYSVSGI